MGPSMKVNVGHPESAQEQDRSAFDEVKHVQRSWEINDLEKGRDRGGVILSH